MGYSSMESGCDGAWRSRCFVLSHDHITKEPNLGCRLERTSDAKMGSRAALSVKSTLRNAVRAADHRRCDVIMIELEVEENGDVYSWVPACYRFCIEIHQRYFYSRALRKNDRNDGDGHM